MTDVYLDSPPLTDEQRAVVEQPWSARVLVTAGAGAGKTHTLVRRLDALCGHEDPEEALEAAEILVLTFSRAAARELRERISRHGERAQRVRARTFDAWAYEVLLLAHPDGEWGAVGFDERIDAMLAAGGPVDLVQALALPVPSLTICELLGVPYGDHAQFEEWSAALMNHDLSPEEYGAAVQALDMYLDELVTLKETEPGDDLISRFLEKNRAEQAADHLDVVTMARMMLVGGHETTANMIALGVLALLEHPDHLAELRSDDTLLPNAIEELLRVFSISDSGTARVAVEDIEVGGVTIRAGEGILALNNAADHDETAAVLAVCAQHAIAVVPFGGGTSVVGGVEPARGPHPAAISLDLARLTGLQALDARSQFATFAAGTLGPEVERLLLCSDGVTGMIDDAQIAEILSREGDAQDAADRLVAAAVEAGGRDNATAVVVDVDAVGADADGAADQPTGGDDEAAQEGP